MLLDEPYRITPDFLNGADAKAAALGHNYVGTEHILLWLAAQKGSSAAEALSSHGATYDALNRVVREMLHTGADNAIYSREMTDKAIKVARQTADEAKQAGRARIAPDDVLLCLLRCDDVLAYHILKGVAEPEVVRDTLLQALHRQ